jgi:hypothetical protein
MATSKGALITSMLAQLTVAEETKDPKQRKRAMGALRRLTQELWAKLEEERRANVT